MCGGGEGSTRFLFFFNSSFKTQARSPGVGDIILCLLDWQVSLR